MKNKKEPNQRENKNFGSIWLWCLSEGYEEALKKEK